MLQAKASGESNEKKMCYSKRKKTKFEGTHLESHISMKLGASSVDTLLLSQLILLWYTRANHSHACIVLAARSTPHYSMETNVYAQAQAPGKCPVKSLRCTV